ncbi:hypothetical protein [Pseudogemmobacter sonorensis]|uniref:hypothetical protein n=1 Tax=Pseudogemmobacter sonorensis TaxID=2989681 RepID=UPI0036A0F4B9
MAEAKHITMSAKPEDPDRRGFLLGLPATGAALVVAGALPVAAQGVDTPILRLFRQHCAIMDATKICISASTGKSGDEEVERLSCYSGEIEDEMMALPCTCAADFAAKVIVDTCRGGIFSAWETGALWIEARALTGSEI